MSIKTKLALVLTLVVTASAAVSVAIFCAIEYSQLKSDEAVKETVLSESVLTLEREAELANDPLMVFDFMRNLMREHQEIAATRVFANGIWVDVELPKKRLNAPPPGETFARVIGIPYIKAEIVFSKSVIDGRIEKALSLVVEETAQAAGLVALLGCLLAFPLSATLTGRLVRIEKALRDIGEGNLGVQTPVSGRDEIAELAHGVNVMSSKLTEVDEMKKTFVASVTHELRSPLGIIESYVKILLASEAQLGPQARSSLEKIGSSAERLSHFVTNLLDMAKIERGKLDFSPRQSDIVSVVEDTVSFFKPRAEELGIHLGCDSEKGLPTLLMDPDLIAHVLTNLLSNAIKFTRPGGSVSVELKRLNGCVECAVQDTGVGIPAEAVVRIFTPFERVKNPLRSTGVGLGLAISKSIVELHGGDIGVSSVPQEGSRFFFKLPVKTS